jgi:CRP-like cAMP-binding protein
MLSTLDKMLVLKSVSMFSEISNDLLAQVVDLTEEVELKAGETIFHKGDVGNSMYVVVEGLVKAHDGELFLNYVPKLGVFGEMSALDTEVRSASITAVEDSLLLKLDQTSLYKLMSGNIEVVRGVIHIIVQRLRARVQDLVEDFEYMQQFARITAAATALEAGVYTPESLDEVGLRTDALGQLARVFQRMVREVHAREQRLQQQVEELRIEIDQVKRERQVSEITQTDYFQDLQQKARDMRRAANSNKQ